MAKAAFSAGAGALLAQVLPGIWMLAEVPALRAAWSWQCTVYSGSSGQVKYMEPNATDGPTCADKSLPRSTLTCDCPASPCAGPSAAVPSDLVCAGAGDDSSSCYKLHMAYGKSPKALAAVAGRGPGATDGCEEAGLIKVYGNADGLATLVSWGSLPKEKADNSSAPADAKACQALCAADADCAAFSFNDQGASGGNYGYFRGLCLLQGALTCSPMYHHHHGIISGPKSCSNTTVAASTSGAAGPALAGAAALAVALL